ncbi:MAG: hypothetical protein KC468_38425, partial [Myxococcales bacterium]|nr:hypothetical protein [Myxococcales bacterium]
MRTRASPWIPLCACLIAASPCARAHAQPAKERAGESNAIDLEAKAHLDRALELYTAGEYEEAIREFRSGYAIDPSPMFLFAWAQAERLTGDCLRAAELYRRFIATDPPEQQVAAAEAHIDSCSELAATEAASEQEQEDAAEPEPEPEPEP